MTNSARVCATCGCVLLLSWTTQAAAQQTTAPAPVTLDRIVQTWKERQARTRSLDITWEGTRFERISPHRPDIKFAKPPVTRKPPPDFTAPFSTRYVLDPKGRSRYELTRKLYQPRSGELESAKSIVVHEDGVTTDLIVPQSAIAYPAASIEKRPFGGTQTWHICVVYWPFDALKGGLDPAKLVMTDARGVVEGRPCVVLAYPEEHVERRLWVDVERDFLPLRLYTLSGGKTQISLEIAYREDARAGWAPSSWKLTALYPTGQTDWSETVTVSNFSINEPIADDLFQIPQFPEKTYVRDHVNDQTYVIRPGGEKRFHTKGEPRQASYLLTTDPPGWSIWRWTWTIATVSAVCLIAAIIAYRYRRRWQAKPG